MVAPSYAAAGGLALLCLGAVACMQTQVGVIATPQETRPVAFSPSPAPATPTSTAVPAFTATATETATATATATFTRAPASAAPVPAVVPTSTPLPEPTATLVAPPTPTGTATPLVALRPGNPATGRVLYEANCARCHGLQGEGIIGDRLIGLKLSLSEVIALVRTPRGMMASFSPAELSDQQIADIYAYNRTFGQ